ncbi:uncharacterized protein LOC117741190 [Cyclopterus lumpus]|uniref:uncharacterized protein LOC117741190 n=1 Tax=Cyclopterus lumpus TaxID=8103 RepID=UPI001486A1D3|nr:uncharacterized protein LOC117741190 [Cyclopterus lumpus]
MEGTRTFLWMFLLLSQLPSCHTDADRNLVTEQPHSYPTKDRGGGWTPATERDVATTGHTNPPDADTNGTRADCLIDTEMGLVAVGSAGGLIVCLLVTTVALACQIHVLQRRIHAPRTSRSNMDLVSGTGYWGVDRPEEGGLVGPCNAAVMLEEVRADGEVEAELREARGEALEQVATATVYEGELGQMQSSSSRDSCLEMPRDLEDMPLVV